LDLAIQMARSLATVHGAGYVHRDIKPSNYLVVSSEDPSRAPGLKLSDFGVGQAALDDALVEARATVTEVHGETLHQAAGTYLYIAPELLRPLSSGSSGSNALAGRAETASDLYSLGVALYQLFAGTLEAIPGPGLRMVEDPILREDLAACLDEDPADRPTAAELVARLADHDKRLRAVTEAERTRLEEEREKAVALAGALEAKRRAGRWTLIAVSVGLVVAVVFGLISLAQRRAAIAARNEAEAARADAEGLVEFMLTDLHKELQPIGQLEILGDVVEQVLAYYEDVDTEGQSVDALRNRARALNNIGLILRKQGDPDRALERHDEAIAITEKLLAQEPNNPALLGDLAEFLAAKSEGLGGVRVSLQDSQRAVEVQRRAVALRERLVETFPDDPPRQHDLAVSLRLLSHFLRRIEPEEAKQVAARGLAIAEQLYQRDSDNVEWLRNLAILKSHVALLLENRANAGAELREALVLRKRLVELDPGNVSHLEGLAWGHITLAGYEENEQSIQQYRAAAEIFRDLSRQDPSNAEWQIALRNSDRASGNLLGFTGHYEKAIEDLTECVAIGKHLVAMQPDDPEHLGALVEAQNSLSQSLVLLDRRVEAVEISRESLAARKRLVAMQPDKPGNLQDLAVSQGKLALILVELGRHEEATEAIHKGVAATKALMALQPEDASELAKFAWDQGELAHSLSRLGSKEEALEVNRVMREIQSLLAYLDPEDPVAINRWALSYICMGLTQQLLGDEAGARASWERAVEIIEPLTATPKLTTVDSIYLHNHAALLLRLGRVDEAQPIVEELFERHWGLPLFGTQIGDLLHLGRVEETRSIFEALLKLAELSPELHGLLAYYGKDLIDQEEFELAQPVLEKCLEIREERIPDSWLRYSAMSMLGESLAGQGKFAEAEHLLVDGYVKMEGVPGNIPPRKREALERLIQLYEDWGKPDEAAKWRQELETMEK